MAKPYSEIHRPKEIQILKRIVEDEVKKFMQKQRAKERRESWETMQMLK